MSMFSSRYAIGAIFLITLQAVLVIIFESIVISYHISMISSCTLNKMGEGISMSDLVYHGLLMVSQIFQILLCLDALFQRNTAQLYALILYDLSVVVYAVIQIRQHIILEDVGCPDSAIQNPNKIYYESKMRPFEYTIIVIIPSSFLILSYFAWHLSKNFTWENYRSYSADIQVRNAAVAFAVFLTFLKLDIFFVLSFAAQLIPSQLLNYESSTGETVAIFVLGSALMALGFFSVYRESKYGITGFAVFSVMLLAYFVWKLALVSAPHSSLELDPYQFTRYFLIFTIITCILLLLCSIINAMICFRNMIRGIVIFQSKSASGKGYGSKPAANSGIFNHNLIELSASHPSGSDSPADNNNMWTIE